MTFDDVVLLTDQQVKGIYSDVYNGFWRRYCTSPPAWNSEEWETVMERARELMGRYESCPMVVHMIQDLMDQLEARSKRRCDNAKKS